MADDATTTSTVVSRYFSALAYKDYRTLWTASLSSGAAAWALIVARGWLVYAISDSSLWVGAVTFAAMVPRAIVSPFSGYLSDRFDRRTVLATMFGVNLVHNLVLALLVFMGDVEIWHLVVLSLVNGSARAAQMPAAQSLIPNLVPRRLLLNAVALNQATMHGSRLVGPAAILPLMAFARPETAFFLCTGFYAVSLVQTLRIRTASTGRINRDQNFVSNLAAGAVYVYRTPKLRAIVFLVLLHCGFTMSFESLLPVLSKQQLEAGGAGVTSLMMAVGTGALLSAVLLAGINSETTKGKLYLIAGVFSGLSPIVLALSSSMPMALLGAAGMGASQAAFMTLTHTMIQSIIPDSVRGRVGGIYSVHIGGTMALVNLVNGGLADRINAPLLLVATGLAFVVVMALSWQYASLRHIYRGGIQPAVATAAD